MTTAGRRGSMRWTHVWFGKILRHMIHHHQWYTLLQRPGMYLRQIDWNLNWLHELSLISTELLGGRSIFCYRPPFIDGANLRHDVSAFTYVLRVAALKTAVPSSRSRSCFLSRRYSISRCRNCFSRLHRIFAWESAAMLGLPLRFQGFSPPWALKKAGRVSFLFPVPLRHRTPEY